MNMTRKKILLFGFVAVLLVGIPLTIYSIKTQQESRTRAEKSTTLSFLPPSTTSAPIIQATGSDFLLDVQVDPGTNLVSFLKMEIDYDDTKIATSEAVDAFKVNNVAFPITLEGPSFSPGKIFITLSVGSDPTNAVQTPTKALSIQFKALAKTIDAPTNITFGNMTEVLSIGGNDQASENVLQTINPAIISIIDAADLTPSVTGNPTPTTAPVATTAPTITPYPTIPTPTSAILPTGITPTAGPVTANQIPVCSALNIDRITTGNAPYSVTYTAIGTDADGTISRVSFNYGDGPLETVTNSGGIGSNSVNVQRSHTYYNPGTYTANAQMTDNQNGSSDINTCRQTIIVLAQPTGTGNGYNNLTPAATISLIVGPGNIFIGAGAVALIFTLVGGFLFFIL